MDSEESTYPGDQEVLSLWPLQHRTIARVSENIQDVFHVLKLKTVFIHLLFIY